MIEQLVPYLCILPPTGYSLFSLYCAAAYLKEEQMQLEKVNASAPPTASVTILKPVKGCDAGSYDNFASFCRCSYSGPMQMVFAVASWEDPTIEVFNRLKCDFPQHDIELVINPAIHGFNYKVSNLINGYIKAKHDIIIVCDSDIKVAEDFLTRVVARFNSPETGLVMSLYRTSEVDGIGAALEASGFTVDMIPNVLVAKKVEGLSFALGASMAVRRQALSAIGGFEALSDYLADDYQLGNKIHKAGWKLELDSCFVESVIHAESIMSVITRQIRWGRTLRASRPGGYFASGITLAFPGILALSIFSANLSEFAMILTYFYIIRFAAALFYSRRVVHDKIFPKWLWIIPIRDLLTFCCWILSFLGNKVVWRGHRFMIRPGGKIEEMV